MSSRLDVSLFDFECPAGVGVSPGGKSENEEEEEDSGPEDEVFSEFLPLSV